MVRTKYEMLQGHVDGSHEDEKEEEEEDGDEISEVNHAKAVAKAFGKSSNRKKASISMEVDEVADGLKELNMDNYDEEDDDIQFFSSGLWDLYYPSNELDPTRFLFMCNRNHRMGHRTWNFVAIGSKETPTIEIWDLDVVDEVLPCVQLGGTEEMKISKEKKNKKAVAWNHYAPEVLLSWSFDQTVVLKDGRQPSHLGFKWSVMTDVETLAWNPHSEHSSVVSIEDGTMKVFDIRAAQSAFGYGFDG
ncbi:hypothetical protein F2Q70_00032783 [Brassica cretica]|uniref:Uncharacterized protein n=1 Tax=Brassica cretica TaxID=69181 RepID=A0A8S9FNG9_BRACR|nr:hypothetical protein F2Q70_00032783 [Brassica cretica]